MQHYFFFLLRLQNKEGKGIYERVSCMFVSLSSKMLYFIYFNLPWQVDRQYGATDMHHVYALESR